METRDRTILAALEAIAAGELDALSAEDVVRVEEFLNETPAAAAQLAALTPPVEPALRLGIPTPTRAGWQRVWERVDAAGTPATMRVARRVLRFWRPLLAAAACLLLAAIWSLSSPAPRNDWPVEWASSIEVDDIQAFNGDTPFVIGADQDSPIPVIWLLEEGS